MRSKRRIRPPAKRLGSAPRPPADARNNTRYLESSAIAAALLEGDAEARASIRELGTRCTSAVTFAETHRAILRARASDRLTDAEARSAIRALRTLERRVDVVRLTDAILDRVRRPFLAEPVRTLDAIHLATIETISADQDVVTVVTRDRRISANALASGWVVEG